MAKSRVAGTRRASRSIPASWLAVHIGQHNWPQKHDPLIDLRQVDGDAILARMRQAMAQAAEAMPAHETYIRTHCAAQPA